MATPGKIALGFYEKTWCNLDLYYRVNRLANALLSLGIGRGDHGAVLSHNRNEILEACFSLSRIGAPFVPINFRLSPREIVDYGSRMQYRTWIIGPEFEDTMKAMFLS